MGVTTKGRGSMRKRKNRLLACALAAAMTFSLAAPALPASAQEAGAGWNFAWFGTSTSAEANTLVSASGFGADGAVGAGAVVSMTSATANADGTINKKGGKFVETDPYQGMSYYYTTIDANATNFYLQADVHVDYINPTPDGQEGFALIARDSIGTSGVSGEAFYSNSVATMGNKFTYTDTEGVEHIGVKDTIGYRVFEGVLNPTTGATATTGIENYSYDTYGLVSDESEENVQIKAGQTYRISLEETDSAYIMTYYSLPSGEVIGQHTYYKEEAGADPLAVMDPEHEYVGFAVARGCNATFSNIVFTTSQADPANWKARPMTEKEWEYEFASPSTSSAKSYVFKFKSNASGKITVTKVTGGLRRVIARNEEVTAGVIYEAKPTSLNTGLPWAEGAAETTFEVKFTPDYVTEPDEDGNDRQAYHFSDYVILAPDSVTSPSYTVSYRTVGEQDGAVYVSADGQAENDGTSYDKAIDLATALKYAAPGQTILLRPETYTLNSELVIERGISGTADKPITIQTDMSEAVNPNGSYAVLDFNRTGTGLTIWGDYWHFKYINITGSADGSKGCQLSGSYNLLEQMNFYNNGNTGLQVSGKSSETKEQWPAYNTILNCTSMNNADSAVEDADGFAAKLTTGDGNVFDGCIAAYNADDGWDCFAKTATGPIGAVTIKNSVAYRNGFLVVQDAAHTADLNVQYITESLGAANAPDAPVSLYKADAPDVINFGTVIADGGNISLCGTAVNAGNGNGFKLGGSAMTGKHVLKNSVSYENKAKGIDSNSCPDILVYNSTSYNNGGSNVALYSNSKVVTDFTASGVLSFRTASGAADGILNISENIKLYDQKDTITTSDYNYFWDAEQGKALNASGAELTAAAFASLDTTVSPTRTGDGSIEMSGLLALTANAPLDVGANLLDDKADVTVWVVGDSTVSAFSDNYYMPRYGWGTQLENYLDYHVTVENLAISGTSSKSFATADNASYAALLDGMQAGDYLFIGFGHNDEKAGDTTYTSPSADYTTAGTIGYSLYENYIKPAQQAGVEVILVTPIVRRSTTNDYSGESGHITAEGDYAQAIRELGASLGITVCDLTAQTMALNLQLDQNAEPADDSLYMHAWTSESEKSVDNTHTNLLGAAENAYLIMNQLQNSNSGIKQYIKTSAVTDPLAKLSYWKAESVNAEYEPPKYDQPTGGSKVWPSFTDANGNVWYASVFGDVGSDAQNAEKFLLGADANGNMQISAGITKNTGKVASTSDGMAMYFVRIPVGSSFSLSADVTLNSYNANGKAGNQQAFGVMARDDMYIDEGVSSTMGDYVSAGTVIQSSHPTGAVTFARKSGSLYYGGGDLPEAPAAGETVTMTISSTTDGFAAKYGAYDEVIAGYDFQLTAIDGDYIYVGFFAARSIDISVSNITLTIDGVQVTGYDCYAK